MCSPGIYEELILSMLDPFFRRRMVPLLNDKLESRFDIEVETIGGVLNTYPHPNDPVAPFFNDVTEHFVLSVPLEGFASLTVLGLMNKILDQWIKWDNPILLYPSTAKILFNKKIDCEIVKEEVPSFPPQNKFPISCNQYERLMNVRKWNRESLYLTLVSSVFMSVWNNAVSDELKLDDSVVWRFIELGGLLRMVQTNVPDYEKPLPGIDRDMPNIPCYVSYKNGKVKSLTIGHFQIIQHHHKMQAIMENQRKRDAELITGDK